MSKHEWLVLCSANMHGGAASYLFVAEIARLERRGLIARASEWKFVATDAGRERWLRGAP